MCLIVEKILVFNLSESDYDKNKSSPITHRLLSREGADYRVLPLRQVKPIVSFSSAAHVAHSLYASYFLALYIHVVRHVDKTTVLYH